MAKAKALTYEEFMEFSRKHYNHGGDAYFECWDRQAFDEYVKAVGEISTDDALQMYKFELEHERDVAGFVWF